MGLILNNRVTHPDGGSVEVEAKMSVSEPNSHRRTAAARMPSRSRRPRSAVTSGRQLFVDGGDANSAWSRRYHDLRLILIADVSAGQGPDALCGAQLSLIDRCASIICELERLDAMLSCGQQIDLSVYASVSGQLRRLLETLYGVVLERKQLDVTPAKTVSDYCESKKDFNDPSPHLAARRA